MKTCPNCRCIHGDDYMGQCHECGRPLGTVSGSTNGDLAFRYANQLGRIRREDSFEQQLKSNRGNARPGDVYDSASLEDAVVDTARRFVVVPPEAQNG